MTATEKIELNQQFKVQELLVKFCKKLPSHLETWSSTLQKSVSRLVGLSNLAEQFRHVERARIKEMANFKEVQENLLFEIEMSIEDDVIFLKNQVEILQKTNSDLKNSLTNFENSTLDLDWTSGGAVIKGSPIQPSLPRLLESALNYWGYFLDAFCDINNSVKKFDIRNETSLTAVKSAFQVDLKVEDVVYLIELTQYVCGKKI